MSIVGAAIIALVGKFFIAGLIVAFAIGMVGVWRART